MSSRRISACPACRSVSAMTWTRILCSVASLWSPHHGRCPTVSSAVVSMVASECAHARRYNPTISSEPLSRFDEHELSRYLDRMTSRISHTSFDCRDAYTLSTFWKGILGFTDVADDPNEPGHEECMIIDPNGAHRLLFIEVPESKVVKNRIHLDLVPTDGTRDQEVERMLAVGATPVDDRRNPDGTGWFVFADPEGNELCVLRRDAERET
jgi:catechol 2,3-dioxygenase-like lactoylglutathione lyase family enzyme